MSSELVVKLSAYPHEEKLCVVSTCSVYLERTNPLRWNETHLFITHQKPQKKKVGTPSDDGSGK